VDESGAELGKLVDIIEMPTQNVYVVRGAAEHLVPDVPEFIRSVDAEKGVITVRLIEGM
jgi:16S rRNA processing protein RimM